jgi:hypothetical protein
MSIIAGGPLRNRLALWKLLQVRQQIVPCLFNIVICSSERHRSANKTQSLALRLRPQRMSLSSPLAGPEEARLISKFALLSKH